MIISHGTRKQLTESIRRFFGGMPCRVQVAALPWRRTEDGRFEVMLVTCTRHGMPPKKRRMLSVNCLRVPWLMIIDRKSPQIRLPSQKYRSQLYRNEGENMKGSQKN